MPDTQPTRLKVACLQLAALNLDQASEALERALALIDRAAEEFGADLIITPECTYPAYVLGTEKEFKKHYPGDPLPAFAERARRHGVHLVVGVATPEEGEKGLVLYNEAVLFGPDGEIIGRTAKSLLWHFDNKWFCAGETYPVLDTALGRIGLMICADGRQPEIARSLALSGAQIIADPTCWVSSGIDPANLTNQQAEYMLAGRAYENGVWCAAADKVGLERGSVLYAGRSSIISPAGEKIAVGSSDKEEIVLAEVELKPRSLPPVPRRPALYTTLTGPTENLPVSFLLQEPLIPHKAYFRVAVAQFEPFTNTQEMGEIVRPIAWQMARESVDLLVLPDPGLGAASEAAHRASLVFPFYRTLSKLTGVALLATEVEEEGSRRYKTACLFKNGEEIGRWRQTHFTAQEEGTWTPGDDIGPVIKFGDSGARLGVMLGADGLVTEVPRSLMLRGADIILWPTRPALPGAKGFDLAQMARTRAAENRIYLAVATPLERRSDLSGSSRQGSSLIVDPSGAVAAIAFPDTAMAVSSHIIVSLSRDKVRAPGTDVVYNRRPETYGALIKEIE